uniref:Glutathione S-transferase n=1 Tax=Panagrolaimus sp. ES5 TaxID=591445 RepID=A0AC34FF63_9BILA
MSDIKLTYFNLRGLGEPARLILRHAKVDFKDERLTHEDWPKLKPKTKTGKVPFLEYDGHTIVESNAINRFLARKYNLAGKDDFEAALIDGIADVQKDFYAAVAPWLYTLLGFRSGNAADLKKEHLDDSLARFLPMYSNFLKEAKSGFMAPSGLSWADFVITEFLITLLNVEPKVLDGHDDIKQYLERVKNVPQLKEYYASRPESKN